MKPFGITQLTQVKVSERVYCIVSLLWQKRSNRRGRVEEEGWAGDLLQKLKLLDAHAAAQGVDRCHLCESLGEFQ